LTWQIIATATATHKCFQRARDMWPLAVEFDHEQWHRRGYLYMQADDRESSKTSGDGSIIETLARETGSEPAYVKELYDREFAQLEATATVKGFLSLLAYRYVRVELRKSDSPAG
jgi:hypothetical protein